jgi:hypothetical protein
MVFEPLCLFFSVALAAAAPPPTTPGCASPGARPGTRLAEPGASGTGIGAADLCDAGVLFPEDPVLDSPDVVGMALQVCAVLVQAKRVPRDPCADTQPLRAACTCCSTEPQSSRG